MSAFFNFKIPLCTQEEIDEERKNGETFVTASEGLQLTIHVHNGHYYIEEIKKVGKN